ncbi:hypothetical protein Tco_1154373 [Tanacetum coccineum]
MASHPNFSLNSKKDSDFDKILDDLFRTGAEYMKRMWHDIVQDSIWEHDYDSEEDQEDDGDDGDTFDMWDITVKELDAILDNDEVAYDDGGCSKKKTWSIALSMLSLLITEQMQGSNTLSWKPCQGGSSKLNLPNHRYKRWCCGLIPSESNSSPHAHAQTTKTCYKHQDSRIKKAQELKTKTFANSDIKDPSSKTKLRGRLLESFQEDAKYEHFGQDRSSQDGKDDKDKQGKDLKISKSKTKSKDNDKG